ncbi:MULTISPECIES: methylenetetrahydrofolate reductase [NAD(P)H] [Thiorhodovibrio]|uniref:methylenetetrahydrofolate reductase [NAD(P)H] n=1 Tax=Thiorhodovibrio TaxID=61593 RepID=UPI0019125984|nr:MULTISPECIES: methylenetetrahydrofolate reductase [NAD(P)H] [Thiorhodovibrio]MBK5969203.1 methylenetetrahydrofolate reductase [NAD(P)H] [Thiorhodovibrio winogradskyi]WPL11194.1 5,10-methylenetetrahydrofolate reductase [Thiorhodovibrio litoralis]
MHTHLQDTLSLEIFPPKTPEGMTKLKRAVTKLNTLKPKYFSCTYGAGGSTRERTFEAVSWLREQQIETAPHLACIGSGKDEIHDIVEHYAAQGITRLVALRGDLPSGMGRPDRGTFRYASELVTYLRETYNSRFHIEVAAYPEFHPQAASAAADLQHFKHKVECGADSAITQYFFNADAYFAFVDACEKLGITVPIIPGIMPITNYSQLARFSDACGAEIPRFIRRRLEAFGDDRDSIRAFGHDAVLKLCERLISGGAPGLHFYTMNQAGPTLALCTELGIKPAESAPV